MTETEIINVLDYSGIDRTGANDSTAAIQEAINDARNWSYGPSASGWARCGSLYLPKGKYVVDSLDLTHCIGLEVTGGGGSFGTAIYACGASSGGRPVFDLTGSAQCNVRGIQVYGQTPDGGQPTNLPGAAFLLAESTARSNDKNRLDDCGAFGWFAKPPLTMIGACDVTIVASQFLQAHYPAAMCISTTTDYATFSPFATIKTDCSAASNITFLASELHGRPNADASDATIYMRNAENVKHFGGLIDNSAVFHVGAQGACKHLVYKCQFYSESGTPSQYLVYAHDPVDCLELPSGPSTHNAFSVAKTYGTITNMVEVG